MALIRDHRVAWLGAFGVTNVWSRQPVTAATGFPAASLGKPLAAYTALRLAEGDRLALDRPVAARLGTGWSSDTVRAPRITLRHLLAHTSGLSNFLGDGERRPRFEPGDSFAYSGVGFMLVQRLLESEGGGSLDAVVARETLGPLGIGDLRFEPGPAGQGPAARGHIPFGRAVAPFGIVFLPLLAAAAVVLRVIRRRPLSAWLAPLLAAAGATAFLYSKAANPRVVPFFVVAFAGLATVSMALGRLAGHAAGRRWMATPGTALAGGLIFLLASKVPVPVPDGTPPGGNAAASLRATAGGLARFLVEASRPTLLDESLAGEFGREQARASQHLAWGLGIGLQRTPGGDALFHWGRNPAARAVMVIYPESGSGIVILANSGTAGDAGADIALRALGGPSYWAEE